MCPSAADPDEQRATQIADTGCTERVRERRDRPEPRPTTAAPPSARPSRRRPARTCRRSGAVP
jgi:hypothetical protein